MIVVRTPFRLPLGGGGTDLPSYYSKYGGFLITAAINKYMFINLNVPAIVDKIRISYSRTETVKVTEISRIQHDIVREALKYLSIDHPLEISSMADLSAGTGMGSSSSYTVGLLKALNAMTHRQIQSRDLAEEACKIEIDLIGKPIGKQDQYAAAFGGIIQLEIDQLGNVAVTRLSLENEIIYELENRLMMFYTDIERDANVILGEQSRRIRDEETWGRGDGETGRGGDGVKGKNGDNEGGKDCENIAGHNPAVVTVAAKLTAVEAMHKIKAIGYESRDALMTGDVCAFGRLLHEHWLTKKQVSDKMSNADIDNWYDLAMTNGALGGKVMGAGGGGFMLFCVENGQRKHLRKTLESAGLRYMDFRFDWEGSKTLVDI